MKTHFEREIDSRTYAFTRISFPGQGPWYRVHCSQQDQDLSFWIKREGEGEWKIQPQLLDDDIRTQEGAFARAIAEHEVLALHQWSSQL